MQISTAYLFGESSQLKKTFLWVLFVHICIASLMVYGLPDFQFKRRPDLTIQLSTLAPSAGGEQMIFTPTRTTPKIETSKTLPKDKEGTQTAKANDVSTPAFPNSATGPANAQTTDADYKAAYLNNPKPPYPPLAVRMRLEGKVTLLVEVLLDGKAGRVAIETSSGHEMLDQSALQAVKQWQFSPARKDGVIITQVVRIPITFNLKSR